MFQDRLASYFHILLAISIIVINAIFYAVIIPLVSMIGLHRRTKEVKLCLILMVMCYYLDMFILPFWVGANLSEINEYFKYAFKGKYTDFSEDWYTHVGLHITSTMTIFAF